MDSKNRDTTALIARRCKPILSELKICCQDHGKSCNGDVLGLGEDDVEINLIDVRRMCLVQRNSATCGYFTLSYVWGGVEQHCLSKSNLDFLRQEGSFNAIMQNIPQVARDAIQLVRGLKGYYLWIDSLCIVQDDAEQKHHQIAHMAQIYSRSFLTIVAAEALNANSGLPCAHYTDLTLSETYPGMEAPVDDNDLEQVLRSSKFGSRAWTYQEILLSRTKVNLQFYALATPVGFLEKGTNQTQNDSLIWLSMDGSTCEKITVSDHQQKAMGTLDSFDLEDLGDFTLIEKHFDIIALSVCYLGHNDCLLEDILVDVMLIQWFGENAERVAIGQVNAQAWERCHRSAKWIKLE
ncbi:Heterokaryon incompatibility protein [Lasiodiplodia theobromae]|uniref:Heterokaryon incompatibility protein n=1 Tax=Lasiodiplodia theobromae TaxID=45133 RepID=UPI0015C2D951|nr:Heterokaryon incompatibility protein [Lasiodiplodia theobromae]KAF4544572.1 Heterokaryon incompatibility protein [Lasiodiplodia theobromae]